MRGLAQVTVIGNVCADPELRYTTSGVPVVSVTIAVNEVYKNSDGEKVERTEFVRVTAWRGAAEVISNYVKKGNALMVVGKWRTDKYTDKNGVERTAVCVVSEKIVLLGGGGGASSHTEEADEPATTKPEDDLPF